MPKVVCWNMDYKRDSWRKLVQMDADVALLQEPCRVPPDVADRVEIEPPDHWSDWDSCLPKPARPHRRPRVAKLSDRVKVDWFKPVPLLEPISEGQIAISDVHTIAAARVSALDGDSEPFIVVSMYAHWKSAHPSTGRNDAQADASVHRIISDLSVFVANADRIPHRILAAGDLNIDCGIDYGWKQRGPLPLWYARCRTVWDRMDALDFEHLGPRYPAGRRADPTPTHLPAETKNVPTQHARQGSPKDARLQLDHVFASRGFHQTVQTRALNGIDEWGPSDHCRLLIKVGK